MIEDFIKSKTLSIFNVSEKELVSASREGRLVRARQYLCYFLTLYTKLTQSEMHRILGYTDKSRGMVQYNFQVVSNQFSVNKQHLDPMFHEVEDIILEYIDNGDELNSVANMESEMSKIYELVNNRKNTKPAIIKEVSEICINYIK